MRKDKNAVNFFVVTQSILMARIIIITSLKVSIILLEVVLAFQGLALHCFTMVMLPIFHIRRIICTSSTNKMHERVKTLLHIQNMKQH